MEKERRGRWKGFLNNKFGQQSIILSLFNEVSVHFIRPFQPKREEEMVIYLIAMETRSRSPFLGCHKLVVRVGFDVIKPKGGKPHLEAGNKRLKLRWAQEQTIHSTQSFDLPPFSRFLGRRDLLTMDRSKPWFWYKSPKLLHTLYLWCCEDPWSWVNSVIIFESGNRGKQLKNVSVLSR